MLSQTDCLTTDQVHASDIVTYMKNFVHNIVGCGNTASSWMLKDDASSQYG